MSNIGSVQTKLMIIVRISRDAPAA